jgi:hypothetical protein
VTQSPQTRVLVKSTSDPRQVKRGARTEQERVDERQHALAALLDVEAGRILVMALLNECHVFSSTFSPDPLIMAKLSGEQDVGHKLVDWINQVDTTAFATLLAEARRRDARIEMAARLERDRPEAEESDL